jgi:hypothetical protein
MIPNRRILDSDQGLANASASPLKLDIKKLRSALSEIVTARPPIGAV